MKLSKMAKIIFNLPQDCLGGLARPNKYNRFRAKNGLYYNGYMGSSDAAQDAFGEAFKEVSKDIEEYIKKNKPNDT